MKNFAFCFAAATLAASPVFADPVRVVAAENFYGDLAKQIGGANVEVTSILTNPDQDPHLFEASPDTAKAIAGAKVAIVNGADYDPWMEKLLAASKAPGRKVIVVGQLIGAKPGANPHLWYAPATIEKAADAIAGAFASVDPPHSADYKKGALDFRASMKPIETKMADMRKRYKGFPVAASEPVFGYAADAVGLDVREQKFAIAVMNDAEPSPSDVAGFENDLKGHKLRVMLYNSQASEPAVEKLVALAKESKVPVVGVTETEPPDVKYQDWVAGELDALDKALATPTN
jgi:zinc/manganese transport system substrate-binding protein